MKLSVKLLVICSILLCTGFVGAQTLTPRVVFKDTPQTHNMHIASDGQYLYTCNGGKPALGQISKFTLDGTKIGSYSFELDMRSVMYNPSDKKLYINTYSKELYRIDDLMQGIYSLVYEFSNVNEQATPAISANGKLIYFMEFGELSVYNMKNGELKTTLSGLKCADEVADGGTAVAVDKKHIYTWDGLQQKVFVYDLKGKYQKALKLNQGDYGFSLAFANGMLWVSTDGNYEEGTWYGYSID
jgi:hypothetical protein